MARQTLHSRVPADILTTEVAILHHAFRWTGGQGARRGGESEDGSGAFTTHREAGYGAVVGAVILLIVIEGAAVHLLVDLWSGTVAWVLSALAGYGVVWLVGDYRALRARPTSVGRSHLRLRVGIRWEVDVPLDRIEEARPLRPGEGTEEDALVTVVLGAPNVRLRLREPVEVTGVYGIRRTAGGILLRVDGADRFCAALGFHRQPGDPG